jgi:hypothetical protein
MLRRSLAQREIDKKAQHKRDKEAQDIIDEEIEEYFADRKIKAIIQYRTLLISGEYPHNFVTKDRSPTSLRISIEYKDKHITLGNIKRIIACPCHLIDKLPRQGHVRLPSHMEKPDKVDFDKVPGKFTFDDWDELKAHYPRMWKE